METAKQEKKMLWSEWGKEAKCAGKPKINNERNGKSEKMTGEVTKKERTDSSGAKGAKRRNSFGEVKNNTGDQVQQNPNTDTGEIRRQEKR